VEVVDVTKDENGNSVVHVQDCLPVADIYIPFSHGIGMQALQRNGWIPAAMDRQRAEVKEETPTEDIDANFFTFQRQAVHQAQGFATKDVIQGLNGFAPEDCQDFDSGRSSLYMNGGYSVDFMKLVRPKEAAPPTMRELNDTTEDFVYRGTGVDVDTEAIDAERDRAPPQALAASQPIGASSEHALPVRGKMGAVRRRNFEAHTPTHGGSSVEGARSRDAVSRNTSRREQGGATPRMTNSTTARPVTGKVETHFKKSLVQAPPASRSSGGYSGMPISGKLAMPRTRQYTIQHAENAFNLAHTVEQVPSATAEPKRRNHSVHMRPRDKHDVRADRVSGDVQTKSKRQQRRGGEGTAMVATELPGMRGEQVTKKRAEAVHEAKGVMEGFGNVQQARTRTAEDGKFSRRRSVMHVIEPSEIAVTVDARSQHGRGTRLSKTELPAVLVDVGGSSGTSDRAEAGQQTRSPTAGTQLYEQRTGVERLHADHKISGLHSTNDTREEDALKGADLKIKRTAHADFHTIAPPQVTRAEVGARA
jgi:hypothetical protein